MEENVNGLGLKMTLVTKCPECKLVLGIRVLDAHFDITASYCPDCGTGIISNKKGLSVKTEDDFIDRSTYTEMVDFFIDNTRKPRPVFPSPPNCRCTSISTLKLPRTEIISGDDVVNLKIELETTEDAKEFIERM